uniref:Uncharacterized protein n=1 Tax=Romanomermis culicivorax TaxID=13658 RepID=A0A915JSP3_ROMCU
MTYEEKYKNVDCRDTSAVDLCQMNSHSWDLGASHIQQLTYGSMVTALGVEKDAEVGTSQSILLPGDHLLTRKQLTSCSNWPTF